MKEFLQPLRLLGTVQQYDWGKKGRDSLVAKLAGRDGDRGTFAEFWFGAHPKSSSLLIIDGSPISLKEAIEQNTETFLGQESLKTFGPQLPFLFKILSVARPLSIQVHPDLKLAASLHEQDPANYPDANHKPEIGVAASDVQMLCGFRSDKDFQEKVISCSEIVEVLSEETLQGLKNISVDNSATIKQQVYRAVMNLSQEEVKERCQQVYSQASKKSCSDVGHWLTEVEKLYPEGDVGVFSFFMLNIVKLKPGEAVFSLPGVPHAYLSGEIVECMANCDNTIRAGLTSKFKDTEVLLEMVDYAVDGPCMVQTSNARNETVFKTAAREFELTEFNSDKPTLVGKDVQGPAIAFCLEGEAYAQTEAGPIAIEPGEALFFSAALNQTKPLELGLDGKVYLTTAKLAS